MSCGVGRRRGPDPELLWLWCRLAAAVPIRPLAWEPLYAAGAAPEKTKKIEKKKSWLALPLVKKKDHIDISFWWEKQK